MVVADQHGQARGGRTADQDALVVAAQRQDAVVLEQNDRLGGGGAGEAAVRLGIDDGGEVLDHGTLSCGSSRPSLKRVTRRRVRAGVDFGLGDEAVLHRDNQVVVGAAAVEIAAVAHREGGGFGGVLRHLVLDVEVVDGAAVADEVSLEAPALAQDVRRSAARCRSRVRRRCGCRRPSRPRRRCPRVS